MDSSHLQRIQSAFHLSNQVQGFPETDLFLSLPRETLSLVHMYPAA